MILFKNYMEDNIKVDNSVPEFKELLNETDEKVIRLSKIETWRSNEFYLKHKEHINDDYKSIGGGLTYIITPTSIGNLVHIKCNKCGEILDITDFDSW